MCNCSISTLSVVEYRFLTNFAGVKENNVKKKSKNDTIFRLDASTGGFGGC
jgi:hypothetical protein